MTPSKTAYSHTVKDKVYYIMTKYKKQKPEQWSFNRLLRVYFQEWFKITLPKKFDEYEGVGDLLDRQSGVSQSNIRISNTAGGFGVAINTFNGGKVYGNRGYDDFGGISRVFHSCPYDSEEYELLNYCPKVSSSERNSGLGKFEEVNYGQSGGAQEALKRGEDEYIQEGNFGMNSIKQVRNAHPTLKPISLTTKIMTLFKLPIDDQRVYIPFTGTFSEVIGAVKAGIKEENIDGCELSEEYVKIGQARLAYWKRKREPEKPKPKPDENQTKLKWATCLNYTR